MSDQTEMYISLEGQMEALEHHKLLAPGSTALDNVRSVTFDPELGGYEGDKPKDLSPMEVRFGELCHRQSAQWLHQ